MRCPKCEGYNTYTIESRPKSSFVNQRRFNSDEIPENIKKMYDYRLRRCLCRDCKYTFLTVEIFYDKKDIELINSHKKQGT